METIDIMDFRMSEKGYHKEEIDVEFISNLLENKGLVKKKFGLCAEPWNLYFEIGHIKFGESSTSAYGIPNEINVELNESISTRKKIPYYHSLQINYIDNMYYICCLSQRDDSETKINLDYVVYKLEKSEVKDALDLIFEHVEK